MPCEFKTNPFPPTQEGAHALRHDLANSQGTSSPVGICPRWIEGGEHPTAPAIVPTLNNARADSEGRFIGGQVGRKQFIHRLLRLEGCTSSGQMGFQWGGGGKF